MRQGGVWRLQQHSIILREKRRTVPTGISEIWISAQVSIKNVSHPAETKFEICLLLYDANFKKNSSCCYVAELSTYLEVKKMLDAYLNVLANVFKIIKWRTGNSQLHDKWTTEYLTNDSATWAIAILSI